MLQFQLNNQKIQEQLFTEIDVFKNYAKFAGKHFSQVFFNKVTVGQFFPINFANFLRTSFLKNNFVGCFIFSAYLFLLMFRFISMLLLFTSICCRIQESIEIGIWTLNWLD